MNAKTDPHIRTEEAKDCEIIYDLTKRAFAPMPFAAGDEQDLINSLRDNGALSLSLVAEYEDQIIGHVAFSPAIAKDDSGPWYGLGPVSVAPEFQSQGVGSALINQGLDMLRKEGTAGCILVGNVDYYKRFGFEQAPTSCPTNEPKDNYMILPMAVSKTSSVIDFHPLFHDAG